MRLTGDDGGRVIEFFGRLYANAEAGSLEIRCLAPRDGVTDRRSISHWFRIDAEAEAYGAAQSFARDRSAEGYDVFFGVNPRVHGGQDDDSVLAGVALWADIDALGTPARAEEELGKCLEFPLPIDAAVFSGNGLHIYSFLREAMDPAREDWAMYLGTIRAYAKQFGGDPVCVNPSRVLRFPLSYSHKRDQQTLLWMRQ